MRIIIYSEVQMELTPFSQFMYQDGHIQLPSLMSHRLTGLMDVFRQLESYITLDTSRIFNVILLQHTQVLHALCIVRLSEVMPTTHSYKST